MSWEKINGTINPISWTVLSLWEDDFWRVGGRLHCWCKIWSSARLGSSSGTWCSTRRATCGTSGEMNFSKLSISPVFRARPILPLFGKHTLDVVYFQSNPNNLFNLYRYTMGRDNKLYNHELAGQSTLPSKACWWRRLCSYVVSQTFSKSFYVSIAWTR